MVENNKSERFKIDKIDKVEEILINKTKYFRYVCESDRKVNSNENYLILFNGKEIKELIIYTGNHPKFTYKYEDPEDLGLDNLGDFRIEQSLSDENTYLIRVEKKSILGDKVLLKQKENNLFQGLGGKTMDNYMEHNINKAFHQFEKENQE